MISVKLNVSKVDKAFLFKGKNGMMLDLVLIDKPTDYGDGFVKQSLPKEELERRKNENIETPIIGNWKIVKTRSAQPSTTASSGSTASTQPTGATANKDEDDVPF